MIDLWISTPAMRATFGALAAIISVIAYLPYMLHTLQGHTRPHRACWLIWSALALIAFFSQSYEGATVSLWFSGAQALCTTTIFLLAVVRGQGRFMTRADGSVLCIAGLGLVLWYMTDSAVFALLISITISLLGGILTMSKVYWFPNSETMSTWALSFVASCFALASVGQLDWVLLAYPLYLFVLNGAIVSAWVIGNMPAQRQRQEQMGLFVSRRRGPQIGE